MGYLGRHARGFVRIIVALDFSQRKSGYRVRSRGALLYDGVLWNDDLLNSEDLTVYDFDHSGVDGNPEVHFKLLKRLVGERGFEPPTPWSRTRCSTRLSHSPTKASPLILLHVIRHVLRLEIPVSSPSKRP